MFARNLELEKIIMRNSIVFLAAMAVSGLAVADELIVTGEKAGTGSAIALDYASTGTATGFQFQFEIPGADSSKVKINLANCLKGLPSSHSGACNFAKGKVIGMVFSDSNELLPQGVLSLGSFTVSGATSAPKIVEFVAADASGNKIAAGVEMGSDAVENKIAQ
jgi:hypothetical protein